MQRGLSPRAVSQARRASTWRSPRPAGLARRQRPRAAGPVLAPPLDDDLRSVAGHGHRRALAESPSSESPEHARHPSPRVAEGSVGQTANSNRGEPASVGEAHGRRRVRQRRCARRSGSLNRISKCFCVFANPSVPCHDHDQRRWLVNKLRCRQVHGVERANWLDRKRSADASENCVCDSYYVTAKLKTPERAHCRLLFAGRQPRRCTRSKNRPCGFGNRQCGGDLPPSSADRFECV